MIEWITENLWAAWLALTLTLLVIELLMLDMLFLMLAAGAGAATTVALAGGDPWLQVVVGSGTALLMLGAVRPVALRHLRGGTPEELTNIDRVTGMDAEPLETVTRESGLAEVDGETWTARSVGDEPLEPGAAAVVDSVDGATVYLKAARAISWHEPDTREA